MARLVGPGCARAAGAGLGADTVDLVGITVDEGDPGASVVGVAAAGLVESGRDHGCGVVGDAGDKPLAGRGRRRPSLRAFGLAIGQPQQCPLVATPSATASRRCSRVGTKPEAVVQQRHPFGVQALLQLCVGHPRGLVTSQPAHHRGEPGLRGGKRPAGGVGCAGLPWASSSSAFGS